MTTHTKTDTENWSVIEEISKATLPESVVQFIEQCMSGSESSSMLIAVLHKLQSEVGHLGKEQINAVAQLMRIPTATVTGVATFYHFFQLHPPGRFHVNICLGTACYVKGADKVADKFKEAVGIDFGQTSKHGTFSLQGAACLGTCGLAPVVMINQEVHARVTPDEVPSIIKKCRDSLKPAPDFKDA